MEIIGAENDKQKELIAQAVRMWGYFPFRRCWIVEKEGMQSFFVLKATAHTVNKYARAGYLVRELRKDPTLDKRELKLRKEGS